MLKRNLNFIKQKCVLGKSSANKVLQRVFHIGLFFTAIPSYFIGKFLSFKFAYPEIIIKDGYKWCTGDMTNNLTLGLVGGIFTFLLLVVLWKASCELVLIIFRCLETYIKKNETPSI